MDIHNEIEAFENWLETNYLPVTSQFLWYKLLSLFAKAGYPEWLTISNQVLMAKTGINSKHTLIEARNQLLEAGLIEIRTGKKGEPTSYRLISIQEKVQKMNHILHSKNFGAEKGAKNAPNNAPYLENGAEYGANFEPNIAPKEGKGAECGAKNAPNPAPEKQQNPVDSCSQTTIQNPKTETHNCLNNIVNNVVVNNVCSYTTTNEKEQKEENRKEMIVELTKRYREATKSNSEDDYKYIGRLLKEYDAHLIAKACDELELVLLERKVDNPRGYLRGILKNLQSPPGSQTNNTVNTTGGEKQPEPKIIDWSEDFLRRAKNDKYAQFYEWG